MAFKVMQPDGSEAGLLVVANGNASTNPIVTVPQSHLVYHKEVYWAGYYFLYIYIYIYIPLFCPGRVLMVDISIIFRVQHYFRVQILDFSGQ